MSCGRCALLLDIPLDDALKDCSSLYLSTLLLLQVGVTHSTRVGEDDTKTLKQLTFQVIIDGRPLPSKSAHKFVSLKESCFSCRLATSLTLQSCNEQGELLKSQVLAFSSSIFLCDI